MKTPRPAARAAGGGGIRRAAAIREAAAIPGRGATARAAARPSYDSVLLASDELMKKQSGRKADILLTDGVDTGSKVSMSTAIEAAQRADTLLYSVRYYDETDRRRHGREARWLWRPRRRPHAQRPNSPDGKKILERMSKETGGGYFEVSKKHPIEDIYRQIEEELRNQYSIGYTSDKPAGAGEFRKIQVALNQRASRSVPATAITPAPSVAG